MSISQISSAGRPPIGEFSRVCTGGASISTTATSERALTGVSYSVKREIAGTDPPVGGSWIGKSSGGYGYVGSGNLYIQGIGYASGSKIDSSGSINH